MYSLILLASALATSSLDPHAERTRINRNIFAIVAEKPEVLNVKEITINPNGRPVGLRVYTPSQEGNLPIILFMHGGGWVAGNLDTHDNLARYLSQKTNSLVFSIDYKNSPEGKFPLPLEQCYDALVWIVAHAKEFQADPQRVAVVGDSAGGNFAAALSLMDRDRNGPKIDLQVLINPATDLTGRGTLQPQGDHLDQMRWFALQYVKNPEDVNNPYVSPLKAKNLSNLPPALVLLAENDELREEGAQYAERLIAAGVPTNVYIQWGVGHLAGQGARASPLSRESLDVACAAIRGAFFRKEK